MSDKKLLNKDDLIYDLIFSENCDYEINIAEYIKDIYKYDGFIEEIREILDKSKVYIIKDKVKVESTKIIWKLKVKK